MHQSYIPKYIIKVLSVNCSKSPQIVDVNTRFRQSNEKKNTLNKIYICLSVSMAHVKILSEIGIKTAGGIFMKFHIRIRCDKKENSRPLDKLIQILYSQSVDP